MKRKKLFCILSIGLMIGFALPNESRAFDFDEGAQCWSAQVAGGSNDGYYKCLVGGGCKWIKGVLAYGEATNCRIYNEDE